MRYLVTARENQDPAELANRLVKLGLDKVVIYPNIRVVAGNSDRPQEDFMIEGVKEVESDGK